MTKNNCVKLFVAKQGNTRGKMFLIFTFDKLGTKPKYIIGNKFISVPIKTQALKGLRKTIFVNKSKK